MGAGVPGCRPLNAGAGARGGSQGARVVPAASGPVTRLRPARTRRRDPRPPTPGWVAPSAAPRTCGARCAGCHAVRSRLLPPPRRWRARPSPGPGSGDRGAERGHSAQSGNYFVPGHYQRLPRSGCRQNGELGRIGLGARGGGLQWVDATPRAGGNPSPESSALCWPPAPNIYNCVLRTLETRSPWGLAGRDAPPSCCRTEAFRRYVPLLASVPGTQCRGRMLERRTDLSLDLGQLD